MAASNVRLLPITQDAPGTAADVQWYDRAEVARRTGLSERTIRRWTDTGILPVLKIGKIVRIPARALADLEARLLAGQPITRA